jgi:hypothetical protein
VTKVTPERRWRGLAAALSSNGEPGGCRLRVVNAFVERCAAELELCAVRPGETVAVLSAGDERREYADAFPVAARRLGAAGARSIAEAVASLVAAPSFTTGQLTAAHGGANFDLR